MDTVDASRRFRDLQESSPALMRVIRGIRPMRIPSKRLDCARQVLLVPLCFRVSTTSTNRRLQICWAPFFDRVGRKTQALEDSHEAFYVPAADIDSFASAHGVPCSTEAL